MIAFWIIPLVLGNCLHLSRIWPVLHLMFVIVLWPHFSIIFWLHIYEKISSLRKKKQTLKLGKFSDSKYSTRVHDISMKLSITHHLSTSLTLSTPKHPKGSQRWRLWSLINLKVSSFQIHSSLKILGNFIRSLIQQIFIKFKPMLKIQKRARTGSCLQAPQNISVS